MLFHPHRYALQAAHSLHSDRAGRKNVNNDEVEAAGQKRDCSHSDYISVELTLTSKSQRKGVINSEIQDAIALPVLRRKDEQLSSRCSYSSSFVVAEIRSAHKSLWPLLLTLFYLI